jgi:hypothetical protein
MGHIAEVLEPTINVTLKCKRDNQKYLIEFILVHSALDLKALAMILQVNPMVLSQTLTGIAFLTEKSAIKLAELFVMLINE